MKNLFKSRFGTVYVLFFVFVTVSALTRTVLFLQNFNDIECSLPLILKIYGMGLFFDMVTFSYGSVLLVLYLVVVPNMFFRHRLHKYILYAISIISLFGMFFISFAEYFFWDEFGTRFNFIAVDYLIYTREVVGNIWESYPMPVLLSVIVLITIGVFAFIKGCIAASAGYAGTWRRRLAGGFVLLSLPVFSYFYVDLSFSSFSENKYVNSLATNGIYAFGEAFWQNSLDYYKFYETKPDKDVFKDLRQRLSSKSSVFTDIDPLARTIKRVIKKHPDPEGDYNVILIMMESMSAKYFKAFGNKDHLTPNLDEIARDGMLFKNLYATGNRTVRGMEAVMLSVPPTPGRSIVKRPHNENLYTIGSVFADKGYENKFIYGGHGYFDNMNYFFGNNGFTIVDRKNFSDSEVTSETSWGVCDQNLFDRVLKESDASYGNRKKFFSFVMTTSNHRPFIFPDSKIDIPANTRHRNRKRGVAYADQAIGEFMAKARTRPWFKKTLFVIVADHCGSSAGKTDLPIKNYKIPLIIYSPALIPPAEIQTLASQMDIGPTIFDLLNWQYESSFFGQSILTLSPAQERAFIANYIDLGYLTENTLTILKPGKTISTFIVDRKSNMMYQVRQPFDEYQKTAIDYYQGASFLFRKTMRDESGHFLAAHGVLQGRFSEKRGRL